MKKCIAIFGPTASGKSSLALKLAKELDGVIISADSMQIYKEMNIGTAKPTTEEMTFVPHKMIDFLSPNESFSVYDYKRMAEEEIQECLANGKLPILVGGTGLYFDALFYNTDFGEFEVPEGLRAKLMQRAQNGEADQMLSELREIDPATAEKLCNKDVKRIVRALEVYLSTGQTISERNKISRQNSTEFSFLKVFLNFSDRQNLYNRINLRVDQMLENGLLEETRTLLEKGYLSRNTAAQAIGYKELLPYFKGEKTLDECVEILKQKTRNYAKRQLTWFRRYTDSFEITMDTNPDPYSALKIKVKKFMKGETE